MAGKPLRRARLYAETTARTGGNLPETWDLPGAELASEAAAVRLLLQHHGNVSTALHALAPITETMPEADQRRWAARYFGDENRFMATLRAEIEREREELLAALLKAALDYDHPDIALRAVDSFARIAGWFPSRWRLAQAQKKPRSSGGSETIAEALALLQHEPGAAVGLPLEPRHERAARAEPEPPAPDDDE
jgi:hypothetical protein